MRLVNPTRGNIPYEEARPWRAALARLLAPEAVARLQLPIFAPAFTAAVRAATAMTDAQHSAAPMLWCESAHA